MAAGAEFESWCWRRKPRQLSNESLFSVARQFADRTEVPREELEEALQQLQGSPQPSEQARRRIEEQTVRELADTITAPGAEPPAAGQGRQPVQSSGSVFTRAACLLADEAAEMSSTAGESGFSKAAESVRTLQELEDFASQLQEHVAAAARPDREGYQQAEDSVCEFDAGPGAAQREAVAGAAQPQGRKGLLQPADAFPRSSKPLTDEELFNGVDSREERTPYEPGRSLTSATQGLQKRLARVSGIIADHHRLERKAARRAQPQRHAHDVAAAVAQLIEQSIVSPSFRDSFFVNRDAAAWLLAKKSYLAMDRLMHRRRPVRRGTHASGSRGLQTVLPDCVQPARRLGPHLAVLPTLLRSLRRRATAPYAPQLEEADLMEYATRSRVGCSVVLALDVSGAVQFGRRIQGVRKSCMAFAYYLRRFHPTDKVRFVAYHESVREVPFADVARLRSVNGAGKNIGLCLSRCRDLLNKDRDRVPVVLLIGDGLPVRGDRAGFYRFAENNQDCIQSALHAADLLRREKILFTFYQFMDDRHLWRDLADDMARRITARARGSLYRIENPDTMALSLMTSYERVRASVVA